MSLKILFKRIFPNRKNKKAMLPDFEFPVPVPLPPVRPPYKMYCIEQVNYHYYSELTDYMNEICKGGHEIIQVLILTEPSGDNDKMHMATLLVAERKQ